MADDIDRAQERDAELRELAIARQLVRARAALARTNPSGECGACGVGIDPRRLAALPGAQLCIECAQTEEIRRVR